MKPVFSLIFTGVIILCCAAYAQAVQTTPRVPKTPPVPHTQPVPRTPPVPMITRQGASEDDRVAEQKRQRRHLEKAFNDIDRDGNGLITGAEFAQFYHTSSENVVFVRYDRDNNYLIDRSEFFALSINGKPLKPEK